MGILINIYKYRILCYMLFTLFEKNIFSEKITCEFRIHYPFKAHICPVF